MNAGDEKQCGEIEQKGQNNYEIVEPIPPRLHEEQLNQNKILSRTVRDILLNREGMP